MKACRDKRAILAAVSRAVLLSALLSVFANAEVLPEKGRETTIACREFPNVSYRVLIPNEYDPAKPCPIIYTFSPGGGGMIAAHQSACQIKPTILVGVCGSSNGKPEMDYIGETYAVMLDTLDRFSIDPGAEYCAGLSGGAVVSYSVARQNKERICGVMASGGWLQNMYQSWFVYPKGLLVARVSGINDEGAKSWAKKDMDHLRKSGCKVKDWSQPGGHEVGTPENIKEMMRWLIEEKSADTTVATAQGKADRWASSPYSEATIKETLDAIKAQPHTKAGALALLHLSRIMKDDVQFSRVTISASAKGPELTGFFGYMAYGAAMAGDRARFRSATYALGKVCPDKDSKWGGIIGALYLFSPGDGVIDAATGLAFAGKYVATPGAPPYNQLVYAAALLKNGKEPLAAKAAEKIGAKATDPKLVPVLENLKKGLKEGASALDPRIWLAYFGEGD